LKPLHRGEEVIAAELERLQFKFRGTSLHSQLEAEFIELAAAKTPQASTGIPRLDMKAIGTMKFGFLKVLRLASRCRWGKYAPLATEQGLHSATVFTYRIQETVQDSSIGIVGPGTLLLDFSAIRLQLLVDRLHGWPKDLLLVL